MASGVREVFTPHNPVTKQEYLHGRESVVSRIIKATNTPGQHALLYGDRGIGKTSVANIGRRAPDSRRMSQQATNAARRLRQTFVFMKRYQPHTPARNSPRTGGRC